MQSGQTIARHRNGKQMCLKIKAQNSDKVKLSPAGAHIQDAAGFQNVGSIVRHSRPEDEEEAESLDTHSCFMTG